MPSPAKIERVRDAERTRAELLAVATEVFAEDGYSGARVDDIAERTRTTKRMIYYYFGGKEQLYRAVLEQAYTTIREAEKNLPLDDLAPIEALRQLAEFTYDHHREHPAFIRLVSIENIHRGESVRQIPSLPALSAPLISRLETLLAAGRATGEFRSDVDAVDVHLVISAYCVFQIANQHTFRYLFGRDLTAAENRDHLRATIGDVVVGWITSR